MGRSKFTLEEKLWIAKACIRGELSQNEAAAQIGVYPTVSVDLLRQHEANRVGAFYLGNKIGHTILKGRRKP